MRLDLEYKVWRWECLRLANSDLTSRHDGVCGRRATFANRSFDLNIREVLRLWERGRRLFDGRRGSYGLVRLRNLVHVDDKLEWKQSRVVNREALQSELRFGHVVVGPAREARTDKRRLRARSTGFQIEVTYAYRQSKKMSGESVKQDRWHQKTPPFHSAKNKKTSAPLEPASEDDHMSSEWIPGEHCSSQCKC